MYDPARDIFTENKPVASPPAQRYQLSALDTLAGLAAEAEIASVPVKQEQPPANVPAKQREPVRAEEEKPPVKVNGAGAAPAKEERAAAEERHRARDGGGGGGVTEVDDVARTNRPQLHPERSLKVTLYLKRNRDSAKKKDISDVNGTTDKPSTKEPKSDTDKPLGDSKQDPVSPIPPMKKSSPPPPAEAATPPADPPKSLSPIKVDTPTKETPPRPETKHEGPAYPIPLSFSKLAKIPKRKIEDREKRVDREQNRSRNADRERPTNRSNRSPADHPRSPRPRSPTRRGSMDDRYRPSPHVDSYRPSRDRDDHHPPRDRDDHYPPRDRDDHYPPRDRDVPYIPNKRPRTPSPPRQFKRPVRRDVSAADRERERREHLQRETERSKANLEAARNRPVYEAVRQHYNDREDRGREARQESRIYRLRKFNNWIKSVLIGKFIPERTEEQVDENRGLFVLDMGCGKGGDLGKWQKQGNVEFYVGVDVADVSVMHAEQRAAELRGRRFETKFFAIDCFVEPIRPQLPRNFPLFDVVSMQFVMHYAFESEEKARTMLMNVSKNLRRGGFFIGTIPSSDAIIEGIKSLPEDSKEFGNSVYKVRFPERPTQTVFRPPYGHRYNFFMEDAVENVPEYIVPFEVFRGLAEDANLEMVYRRSFHEMYEDEKDDATYGRLLDRMGVQDEDGNRGIKSISEEWDAAGLYLSFAFEKRGGY